MVFCPKCGSPVPDGANFCPNCKEPINTSAAQIPTPLPPQPAAPPPPPSPQQSYDTSPAYQQPPMQQPGYGAAPPSQPTPPAYPNAPPQQGGYGSIPPAYPAQPQQDPFSYSAPQQQPFGNTAFSYSASSFAQLGHGSFTQLMHSFGASVFFLTGIILFSVGILVDTLASFSDSGAITTIVSLGMLALPVIGLWLIYAASKNPALPEKTLTALTLFKVHTIITFVAVCIVGALLVVVMLLLLAALSELSMEMGPLFLLTIFLIIAAALAYAIIYLVSLLKVIAGVKNGIMYNHLTPIPWVKAFTIMTFIGIGIEVISIFIGMAALGYLNTVINEIPWDMREYIEPYTGVASGFAVLPLLLSLAKNAGIVMCIMTLNQFNNKLKYGGN